MDARHEQLTRLRGRLDGLATDVGRLRRDPAVAENTLLEWRIDRVADHVEALVGIVEPTAADLVAAFHPGDDAATAAALDHVDDRHRRLRHQLGRPTK